MAAVTGKAEWYEPGVEEVADNVFRIPLPLPGDGLRAVNIYLVASEDGPPVCIDSGWALPEARELLKRCLASLHMEVADVTRWLVTHIHRDHYTQAIALRREISTTVTLGEGERQTLELLCDPDRDNLVYRRDTLVRNGAGQLAERMVAERASGPVTPLFEYEHPDEWLRDGDVVAVPGRTLNVIETPGHTRGHVVFHDAAERLLFAGDHVLSTITPSIGLEASPLANPLGEFLASLARVRELPDARLFPAHGPVRPSVHDRVDELIAHHDGRLERTLSAVRAGCDTGYAVAKRLTWTRHERSMDELDLFNQTLAVTETVAHLRLLEAQGRVRRSDGGVDHYFVA